MKLKEYMENLGMIARSYTACQTGGFVGRFDALTAKRTNQK